MTEPANTFTLLSATKIESLAIEYQEYQHQHTGARHIHLAADNNENVFLVALRTVPTDSTGVAHILEHTSLCGSEKYPVRDPFFMMIRRSLNTFMNAFTSSDWTAYPFASQSRKDFDNLLAVYLDAVFFARLDPLDFAQEGHRVEFENPEDPTSDLVYKGVVFNEMKGAMSSISSQLWQAVGEGLFPDNTYHHNSGGDPAEIPQLSYQQLMAFYKKHYHPDNAVFITYGNIAAAEHQQKFEQLALQRFKNEGHAIQVPLQAPLPQPLRHAKPYPLAEGEAPERNCHRVMAWVLDDIRDPMAVMSAHLLSSILLEDSASPLQQILETTELGRAPSPLCGLDDSSLQMVFICGLEGCEEPAQEAFEELLLGTLQQVAEQGVEQQRLVALLDQLELQQREISGDGYPYGLQLILSCLATAMHRGDPAAMLNIDPVLAQLRKDITDPGFTTALVKRLLLDNIHRVTVTLTPDPDLNQKMIDQEAARLAAIKAGLGEQDKQSIIETSRALLQRQASEDDPSVLPKVGLDDVPPMAEPPPFSRSEVNAQALSFYPQGTNGLTYQQVVCALPALREDQLPLISLHNRLLTEVGVGKRDYLQTQSWQTRVCGGINAFSSMRGELDDEQRVSGYFTLSAKGLSSRTAEIDELLANTLREPRFDEHQRIAELIAQYTARAEQSVTGNGHGLAMSAACQGMSPIARFNHSSGGLLGIQRLKALNKNLSDSDQQEQLSQQLAELHRALGANPRQFLAVAEAGQQGDIAAVLQKNWPAQPATQASALQLASMRQQSRELWVCNSQVNFCAKAYPTVPAGHPDAAALTVLAGVMRNGFLHTAVREQGGAYGGGASQDSTNAAFRFYSYRDPRLCATLEDFDRSIAWVLETQHEARVIEEAILGVIGSLDKPASPAGTAKQHFHDALFGRTHEQQQRFRQAVLEVTAADLTRVTESYLRTDLASIGIVSHSGEAEQYTELCERENISILTL